MKRLFLRILSLLFILPVKAQPTSETIALSIDKTSYRSTDTLYVSGLLVSADSPGSSSLSQYALLELLSSEGKVLVRQKVRCKDMTVHARIPLANLPASPHYFLRAYTRLMRNFPVSHWPLLVFGINQPLKRPLLVTSSPAAGILQLVKVASHLVGRYLASDSLAQQGRLALYAQGHQWVEKEIQSNVNEAFQLPDSLRNLSFYAMVTDGHGKVWAGRSLYGQPTAASLPSMRVESDTVGTGDSFSLQLQAGSEPVSILVRMESSHEPSAHPVQQAFDSFWSMPADTCHLVLTHRFPYTYVPEQVLTLRGQVKQASGRALEQGTLVAFNNRTGHTYEGMVESDGTFELGVDDYRDGNTFFLQAFNRKGKSNRYVIQPVDEIYPGLSLPWVTWANRGEASGAFVPSALDTTRMHWIPEVTVQVRVFREDTPSQKFYQHNFVPQEVIRRESLATLEAILRRMPGIRLLHEAGEGSGVYIYSNRGGAYLGQNEETSTVSIFLDGSWVDKNEKNAYDLNTVVDPMEIESIEYIPAVAAFHQYGVKAFNGVIAIRTRSGKGMESTVRSEGVHFEPLGLSDNRPFPAAVPLRAVHLRAHESCSWIWKAPAYAGDYRVVVEAVTTSQGVVYRKDLLHVR